LILGSAADIDIGPDELSDSGVRKTEREAADNGGLEKEQKAGVHSWHDDSQFVGT
jgi:hypothetical protein